MEAEADSLVGLGWGGAGQLALPSRPDVVAAPCPLPALRHIRPSALACGMAHSGVVTDTGTLLMFGKGKYGRLGTGNEDDTARPACVIVGDGQRVTTIACGGFHTAVVTAKGELYTFGRGDSGQLGHGEKYNSMLPLHVINIQQKVTKVACGVDHTICCTAQGELYGFGSNTKGQLGVGQSTQETFTKPERINYRAYTEGCSSTAYPSSLACGHLFSTMILDGKVFTWGSNDKGQCGTGSVSLSIWNPTPAAINESVFIAIISCGLDHTLAITELGRVYTWGSCEYGQLGIASELLTISSAPSTATNNFFPKPMLVKEALLHEHVVMGCCGSYHSAVVTVDGKLFSWGLGDKGQLGKKVEGSGIAPYPYHIRVKSSNDGTEKIALLAAGGRHTLAALYNRPLISVQPPTFTSDMEKLAGGLSSSSSSFFDVVIYVQDNTSSFDAHWIFLSRVPKLRSLLADTTIQELRFPSISRKCMAIVLNYIYTNNLPAVKDAEVAQLAHDWELHHLYSHQMAEPDATDENLPVSIQRYFKKFVNNPQFSDVTFTFSSEGTTRTKIYAHKILLVSRCEFFSLEFGGNFKESSQTEVSIPDTSPDCFLQLLHYLYTNEVPEQSDWVELLSMSNLYQITHLKNVCEFTIADLVDVDNAVALYEISRQYDAKQLAAFCDYFIVTHYDRVAKTSQFQASQFQLSLLASKQARSELLHDQLHAGSPAAPTKGKCNLQ